MPGKILYEEEDAPSQCKRCKDEAAVVLVRSEWLGRNCFSKYINTKVIKRMETFKVQKSSRASPSNLLLSFSSGISSAVLLEILNHHLENQLRRQPRTGYKLVVLFVDMSSVDPMSPNSVILEAVKERYPMHEFIARPLSDVLKVALEVKTLLEGLKQPQYGTENRAIDSDQQIIEDVLQGATSATARVDIANTLKMRLVAETAKEHSCEAVLWGDSTTRLAEKTLAAAAKGTGTAIPLLLADGLSPYGIDFRYPLRDVLKSEISSFQNLVAPELTNICAIQSAPARISASARNTTIDDLMRQYFESVEVGYPSVISNVVRTSSKLDPSGLKQSGPYCTFCSLPSDLQDDKILCYDCTRALRNPSSIA